MGGFDDIHDNIRCELIAGQQFKGTRNGKLLRVLRGDLTADDEPALNLLNGEVSDSVVRRSPDPSLDHLQERVRVRSVIERHTLGLESHDDEPHGVLSIEANLGSN